MTRTATSRPAPIGFTLVELIAVIVVLSILAAVAVPRYFDYSTRARTAAAASTLKAVGAAFVAYQRDNAGALPPNGSPAQSPIGIAAYLDTTTWTTPTAGTYTLDWDTNTNGYQPSNAQVTIYLQTYASTGNVTLPAADALAIDAVLEDNNTSTGRYRYTSTWGSRYGYVLLP